MRAALPTAAVLLIGVGVGSLCLRTEPAPPQQQRLATVEAHVRQLQAQTDDVFKLVHNVLVK